ncbi:ArnT family glycosyltransferase [Terriglobus albidus]|uniref:ArnT family glycosyltransferase n=1 Tax=Terriglobus albidus TaxID=1592106 RepID=UPI0021E0CD15|nr:hypothetical protein [Terriglobus albidus]
MSLRRKYNQRVRQESGDAIPNDEGTIAARMAIKPAKREEMFPIALASMILAFLAVLISASRGYLLLYGDAVAHLAIARRIIDSVNPGLPQIGSVWLPLPHLLLVPFVSKMQWWQTGTGGTWPSFACYILGNVGFYRLARRMLPMHWAFGATLFYALNPNLLYLATTAMTEPLFLAIFVWSTVVVMECIDAIRDEQIRVVKGRLVSAGILSVLSVYTRYDGWMLAACVWLMLTISLVKNKRVFEQVRFAFVILTVLTVLAPVGWMAHNWRYTGDPLDFIRGPYSAAAIERKTAPPGQHYRGWHNPAWALLFYTRTAQVDAAAWETGFLLMAAAIAGTWMLWKRGLARAAILLWMPLPFYVYSVSFGSVPIFIPQLYPHSYYNARYGMELLPALVVFAFVVVAWFENRIIRTRPVQAVFLQPAVMVLAIANCVAMTWFTPLVLKEGIVNSRTRIPFETSIARELLAMPQALPVMMYTSDHVGAIQQTGIPLKQFISESDYDSFHRALAEPAKYAAYVVAIDRDPVADAVKKNSANLKELTVLCTTGQPCARIYESEIYQPAKK